MFNAQDDNHKVASPTTAMTGDYFSPKISPPTQKPHIAYIEKNHHKTEF